MLVLVLLGAMSGLCEPDGSWQLGLDGLEEVVRSLALPFEFSEVPERLVDDVSLDVLEWLRRKVFDLIDFQLAQVSVVDDVGLVHLVEILDLSEVQLHPFVSKLVAVVSSSLLWRVLMLEVASTA